MERESVLNVVCPGTSKSLSHFLHEISQRLKGSEYGFTPLLVIFQPRLGRGQHTLKDQYDRIYRYIVIGLLVVNSAMVSIAFGIWT